MITGNEPAIANGINSKGAKGLTIRQHFASMAMQGYLSLLADPSVEHPMEPEHLAKKAVEYADALIAELNKEK